jgi:NAD(P)H-nitrite reductase large subunit
MEKIICYCKTVSESQIVQAIKNGAESLKEIQAATNACTGGNCKKLNPSGTCCSKDIIELLRQHRKKNSDNSCECC